ncbi:MAG: hypothetical protein GX213_02295 [Clostridiaceae bacterium]|nr:hypothetical protein [Clostridiaceae bacterium]
MRQSISAFVNRNLVLETTNSEISSGQAALGCSYHNVRFANLKILPYESGYSSCRRYDDKDQRLVYIGKWEKEDGDYNNFGRTLQKSNEKGSCITFKFNGAGVSIIGKKGSDCGIAKIYLDGELEATIDLYNEISEFRKSIFSKYFQEVGEHEVRLVVDESRNHQSSDSNVYIDAVEIMGGKGLNNW